MTQLKFSEQLKQHVKENTIEQLHVLTWDCRTVYLNEILNDEELSEVTYKFITSKAELLDLEELDREFE